MDLGSGVPFGIGFWLFLFCSTTLLLGEQPCDDGNFLFSSSFLYHLLSDTFLCSIADSLQHNEWAGLGCQCKLGRFSPFFLFFLFISFSPFLLLSPSSPFPSSIVLFLNENPLSLLISFSTCFSLL